MSFNPALNPALALDAADGVIDGKFFGRKIVGTGSAPVYRTPFAGGVGITGLGLTGAVGGISSGFSSYGALNSGLNYSGLNYSGLSSNYLGGYSGGISSGLSSGVIGASSYPVIGSGLSSSYPAISTGFGSGIAGSGVLGSGVIGSGVTQGSYFGGNYSSLMGSYGTGITQFASAAPLQVTGQVAPVTQYVQGPPQIEYVEGPPQIEYIEAPPQIQYIEGPPQVQYIEGPPQVQYVDAPAPQPVFLQLPAPPAPAPIPAPLPPPPSVIHIKDDSGPKIASLQAEIRRYERLLATAKETEASLRAEIQELHVRIEIFSQKEGQSVQWEIQITQLREQLLEAQRRIVFLEGQRDEAHKHIVFLESQLKAADGQIAQMAARIRQLESEIASLRMRLETKQELTSRTSMHETYKVKTFEMAAKLAIMDGTDDGLYNGLPIEVEGEGLYKDLVAKGRKPRANVSLTGRPASVTTTSETYKVQTFEMAEKLSKMDGTDDGKYNGLPIEVAGEGLYTDLVRQGRRSTNTNSSTSATRIVSQGGGVTTGSVTGGQTYKVSNLEMAAKISKMGGADDGTYKGLPIEVQGMGLYRDLRGRK